MKYRRLGRAGVKVSVIALGGWINFGEGKVAEETAREVVRTAYDHGINFFDLADSYAQGATERHMGALLKEYPRHTLVVSTKVFWPMSDDVNDRGLSRKHIMESIEGSLDRLGMDYVDIYFCHRPDTETPILETARAMDDLIHRGKVLYWGTSEWTADQIDEACVWCERYGLYPPQAEQPGYSILNRRTAENEILPTAESNGMGLTVFSPLAMGMLTGKYDDGIPEDSRFGREEWAAKRYINDENLARVRQLKPVAADLGISRAQLALAWVLRQPGVSSAIIGATRPSQIFDNAAAADIVLPAEVLGLIDDITGE